jgi:hypothetical protein
LLKEVSFVIYSVKSAKDHRLVGLHALKLLNSIKVTDDTMSVVMEAKKTIEDQLSAKPFSDNMLNDIDQLFKLINNDWKHPNVSDANFDILIDIAIKDAELTGYVSKTRSSNSTICFPGFTSRVKQH